MKTQTKLTSVKIIKSLYENFRLKTVIRIEKHLLEHKPKKEKKKKQLLND
jgi:hypothetical protein